MIARSGARIGEEMNYQEALAYMQECNTFGVVPGLENIKELLARLGNPQEKLSFIHIAGTNGKGSVMNFISTALTEGGYKTGRYISPAIFEYRELFQINGKPISKAELGKTMEPVREAAEAMAAETGRHPTVFEVETALAFLWFCQKKCDIVVLETGMGGLLDATNVIPAPLLCVFASISMDHMAFLGDTLEEIAAQKAGIIKSGSRVVSCRQLPEAMGVIEEACKEKGCELFVSDMESAKNVKYGLEKQRFSYKGHKNLEITMAGIHQIDNCALAVEALDRLADLGFPVKEEKLKAGLLRAKWPGRFEIIGRKPLFIADGAHNEDGAVKLAQSIRFYFTNRRIIYIMGILKDKEVDKIILNTCDYADAIITVAAPGNPRAMSSCELAEVVRRVHENVTAADSPEEAVEMARLLAGKEDVIIAFGSLSFLGDIIRIAEKRQQ